MSGIGTALQQDSKPKELYPTPIEPPVRKERAKRLARFAEPGERKNRYTLPDSLQSCSPIGYRKRTTLTDSEIEQALMLLSLKRPTQRLFRLSRRQSRNSSKSARWEFFESSVDQF